MDNFESDRKEDNKIFLRFDSNFWDSYYSILEQAVKNLNQATGADVKLSRSQQHLGGQKDPHTGMEYREYYHLTHNGREFTIPISLYTPEVLAKWFAEKLDIPMKKDAQQSRPAEVPQPSNPLGTYLGEDYYSPAEGDRSQFGSTYRPTGADFQFRKIQRSPFDARGAWKKEPVTDKAA